MNNYVIMTDSACDMGKETLNNWRVKYLDLVLHFTDDNKEFKDTEIDAKKFYQKMRDGGIAKTSAVNVESFKELFESELKNGKDVLYLGFSSGLSSTFNSAKIAADELNEEYPNNRVLVVDSRSASAGMGLLLYLGVQKRDEGKSIDEVYNYLEEIKFNICHWFTVDDLVYLKRGGRISPTVALVGTLLGIKPILHMDNDGHLIPMTKVRGRTKSIKTLVDKYGELVRKDGEAPIFICHGDCLEDVEKLKKVLKEKYNKDVDMVVNTGPVIGAHSGPGTLSIFFVGKER